MSTLILVVSDSHGNAANLLRAVELAHPDMVFHLGDGWRDAEELARRYPSLPLERVPGNCDCRFGETAERIVEVEGKRILLCHGHTLGVKTDLAMLVRAALERGVDAALFGHTHKPLVDIRNGVTLLNPGSVRGPLRPTYGTLTIADGKCGAATHFWN